MSFRNKSIFFQPKGRDPFVKTRSLAPLQMTGDNHYIVNRARVLRIVVGSSDIYGYLSTEKDATAPDSSNAILFPANETVFMSTTDFEYLRVSAEFDNVIEIEDKG